MIASLGKEIPWLASNDGKNLGGIPVNVSASRADLR
jgi:hypothetical protein